MTPIEKTTKADILNYLRETQTMQFNTRASIVDVCFNGSCDAIRIELIPFIGLYKHFHPISGAGQGLQRSSND